MRDFKLAIYIITLFLSLSTPLAASGNVDIIFKDLEASCKAPKRGPPGPQGPQGPAGVLTSQFASSYSNGSFVTLGSEDASPLFFTSERTPPVGIIHPVDGNPAHFQIVNNGVYFIAWTFSVLKYDGDIVTVHLYNALTKRPLTPTPFSTKTIPPSLDGFNEIISGQTILPLSAGTVIQLQIQTVNGSIQILDPSIIIMQIY